MTAERYDAFVSYGHGDADWVHTLAENLERLELHVFLDDWELVPGDLVAIKLQEGLAAGLRQRQAVLGNRHSSSVFCARLWTRTAWPPSCIRSHRSRP